jgi:hypothetical protein
MTILPLRKSGIWQSHKCHRSYHGSKEVRLQAPAGGHVHDYNRIERGGNGGDGGGAGGRPTSNECRSGTRAISFGMLVEVWLHACLTRPYMDVRGELHAPVTSPQGGRVPDTYRTGGWVGLVTGLDASRSEKFTDPAGNRTSAYLRIKATQLNTDLNLTHNICAVSLRHRQTSIPELRRLIFRLGKLASLEFTTSCSHPMHIYLTLNQ